MGVPPPVEDVLGRVAMWSGRPVVHRPIEGGLSHHIWRVEASGRSYVLRVLDPEVSAAGLGIPPAQEISNTLRAAEAGVGAKVYEVLPEVPAIVLEFLPGRTLHAADVREPATIARIAAACRRLHAGPRFGNDFSILAKLRELVDRCRAHDLRIPDGYLDHLSTVEEVGAALAARPGPEVPCHNDLLAENFIDGADQVRIVDYQLSGNNDPCFELGDIAAEADFDPDRVGALTAAYFGADTSPARVARVRLNLLLSNVTWTLWFSVHHGLLRRVAEPHSVLGVAEPQSGLGMAEPHSGLGAQSTFDYWEEASDKWHQAVRDLTSPELGRLIDLVTKTS